MAQPEHGEDGVVGGVVVVAVGPGAKRFGVEHLGVGGGSQEIAFPDYPQILLGLIDGLGGYFQAALCLLDVEPSATHVQLDSG